MNQVSDSQQASTSSTGVNTSAFWERLWRTAGIQSVGLFIVAYIIYGYQPQIARRPTHSSRSIAAIARGS